MAEETLFQQVIPKGVRLRQLLDVEVPAAPPDKALFLWDAASGRWVARQITSVPHTHAPADISPQGAGSGLDADMVDGQHASAFAAASHMHPDATTTASGFMSAADKTKLDGIQAGAEVNQNAFSVVRVGTTDVVADSQTDTLELAQGANIALTPDAIADSVTIAVSPQGAGSGLDADLVDGQHASAFAPASHTHPDATTTSSGFMSASDKAKLDGIQAGAEVNQNAFSFVKVGSTLIDADSKTDTLELVAGSNISLTPDAVNDKVTIAVSPQGAGSGLHADLLDGQHASAFAPASHTHPAQNTFAIVKVGTTNIEADAAADTLELVAGSQITLTPDAINDRVTIAVNQVGLNADLVDGYHAGNNSNQIPVSNGVICTNLNADTVDGQHASAFLSASGGTISGNLSITGQLTVGWQPFLRRGKSGSQSFGAGMTTKVTWPTALDTRNAPWDSINNRFIASVPGIYLVQAVVLLNGVSGGGRVALRFYRNGVDIFEVFDLNVPSADYVMAHGSALIQLNVNQYVEVFLYCGTARSSYDDSGAGTYNRFEVWLLG